MSQTHWKLKMELEITSKALWFTVENDADRHIIDNIVQTGRSPLSCCENLIYVDDNVLLYNRNEAISLEHGMATLQTIFKLTEKPVRITPDSTMPDYFFKKYLGDGIIEDDRSVKLFWRKF